MPSESEVLSTVTDIVARELGMQADTLTPDLDLRSAEGADSMKVLVMISRIERAYDIEIEDEDVFTLASISDVVRIVLATLETATV
ncbi:acyl carrier protein [Parafrankia sp. EUN1f]|uniref:acyl carrier protein n=1 Tax=Parafrankia sp. EUN1f TaxID=102897 RepID=UPI0001C45DDF|nr:phosphopantetheine-binding protein [Parafrankia sp. EUN1f]EFC86347.1 phosphopantetheine-binding protein [Parafrankia sp. EUN1f]